METDKNDSVDDVIDVPVDIMPGELEALVVAVLENELPKNDSINDDAVVFAEEGSLTPEQKEQKRVAGKQDISHLEPGVQREPRGMSDYDLPRPLFEVGSRVVGERYSSSLAGNPWLDTRVYVVKKIDDVTGDVTCLDEELRHSAFLNYKRPDHCVIKLAPKRGNPFRKPSAFEKKVAAEVAKENDDSGHTSAPKNSAPSGQPTLAKRGRGRPPGSKNRPKDVVRAEKKAKAAVRLAKREARKTKRR